MKIKNLEKSLNESQNKLKFYDDMMNQFSISKRSQHHNKCHKDDNETTMFQATDEDTQASVNSANSNSKQ